VEYYKSRGCNGYAAQSSLHQDETVRIDERGGGGRINLVKVSNLDKGNKRECK